VIMTRNKITVIPNYVLNVIICAALKLRGSLNTIYSIALCLETNANLCLASGMSAASSHAVQSFFEEIAFYIIENDSERAIIK